jgi:dinuclear metal center YbgI/SA1388 family protein
MKSISSQELFNFLTQELQPQNYKDYCPNGLQVEGSPIINSIITGVSLNEALIDEAIKRESQAILVHHGIFWNKESQILTGIKRNRIFKLLSNNINLYAYHLPLDNHPSLGNNIQLAHKLKIKALGNTGYQNLIWYGELEQEQKLSEFLELIKTTLGREPLCFTTHPCNHLVKTIAWCTGGGDGFFEEAINLGIDVYLTGEAAEPTQNLALESKVEFICAGHYATERYGVMALGDYVHSQLGIKAEFIELYNPI